MRHKCPVCKRTINRQDERRYLDKQFMPVEWDAVIARIYRYKCRRTRNCETFEVVIFNRHNDKRNSEKHLADPSYWNLSQKEKPGQEIYGTAYGEYTNLIHVDTGKISRKLLKRERFLADHYHGQDMAQLCKENRKRVKRFQRLSVG